MRASRVCAALALLAAACGGEQKPADQSAPAASTPAPAGAPEAARPADSASSARAPGVPATPSVKAAADMKNAAAPGELRDSVIKPSVVIDEKTGAATPIRKKPC
ncbi:MAG: hypothetical protein HYR75_09225 [Gemmatimonadetes bacterium]|nr:hypothetical protein [Gemmatimonadota bacterium]MBI3569289.1 hypothetical protein [Gemmatimonadota bacterium]